MDPSDRHHDANIQAKIIMPCPYFLLRPTEHHHYSQIPVLRTPKYRPAYRVDPSVQNQYINTTAVAKARQGQARLVFQVKVTNE
jgi:hypothetical protein